MIELANDPNAKGSGWRADASGKAAENPARRVRPAHAWPFLSRYAERPAAQHAPQKPAANDSGS